MISFPAARRRPAKVEAIIATVCRQYEIKRSELLGPNRFRPLPQARAEVCTALYAAGMEFSAIARMLGLHHTSVMYHCRSASRSARRPAAAPAPGNTRALSFTVSADYPAAEIPAVVVDKVRESIARRLDSWGFRNIEIVSQ